MPRQNRVTPFSTLIVTTARGTLMGNRGCLHDAAGQIRRQFLGKRWIICLLEFNDRKRSVMTPGQYTELFFLDEATALAAGHRPCAECQRSRFNLFREYWMGLGLEKKGSSLASAVEIDDLLHSERLAAHTGTTGFCDSLEDLPDGVFVTDDEKTAYLLAKNNILRWSPAGYEPIPHPPLRFPVRILTPPSVVRMLAAGYPVGIHSSAFQEFHA